MSSSNTVAKDPKDQTTSTAKRFARRLNIIANKPAQIKPEAEELPSRTSACTAAAKPEPEQRIKIEPAFGSSTLHLPRTNQADIALRNAANNNSVEASTRSIKAERNRARNFLNDDPSEVQLNALPMTHGTACGNMEDAETSKDLKGLKMYPDQAQRPLWLCPGGRIIFETFHAQAAQVTDFLIAVSEPVSRPELIHEYQITVLSLTAAISNGIDVEQIIKVLNRLSKNLPDDAFLNFIRERGKTIGKMKLVLRDNRYFLESLDNQLLQNLCSDSDVKESLITSEDGGPDVPVPGPDGAADGSAGRPATVEVNALRVEKVKAAAHRLHVPLVQEYEFRRDRTEGNPELSAVLRPNVCMRPYQQRALSKMFSVDGVAKSGIVVLPCGAGKTLVGIAACCRVGRRALVLTSTSVAVDQWRRQFQLFTTIPPEDVYTLTAESKRPIEDAERRACVVVSTYSMLGYTGRRSSEADFILSQLQQLDWGLLVVDEVQMMPARTFRTVATTVKAHCCLGLTATLVREDNLIYDLHWLIGPKLYEASWQQLQNDGFLARVRCVEVWCEMTPAFFAEYLKAVDGQDVPPAMRASLRRALWTCNPEKLKACEYLIRFHENRGDKIIVFSDNIFILKEFAKKLQRYFICGSVDMRERMQILSEFQESSACNTIFISKVGDNAIDLPVANVIVQISAHYGSRRQEAQRLGRILRPKPRSSASGAEGRFNAFFYSLVSRDTQEMYYANRRQQFLVEQGYNYQVLRDKSVERMDDKQLVYANPEVQLTLLKQVLESVRQGDVCEDEDDELGMTDLPDVQMSTADQATAELPQERPLEQKVSLASLSGGFDGAYSVTSTVSRKRLKVL